MRSVSALTLTVLALTGLVACGGGEETCEAESYQCTDAEVLQVCTDGAWVDEEDCAAIDMMCHAEMGHCMDMSEDDTQMGTDTDDMTGM